MQLYPRPKALSKGMSSGLIPSEEPAADPLAPKTAAAPERFEVSTPLFSTPETPHTSFLFKARTKPLQNRCKTTLNP